MLTLSNNLILYTHQLNKEANKMIKFNISPKTAKNGKSFYEVKSGQVKVGDKLAHEFMETIKTPVGGRYSRKFEIKEKLYSKTYEVTGLGVEYECEKTGEVLQRAYI